MAIRQTDAASTSKRTRIEELREAIRDRDMGRLVDLITTDRDSAKIIAESFLDLVALRNSAKNTRGIKKAAHKSIAALGLEIKRLFESRDVNFDNLNAGTKYLINGWISGQGHPQIMTVPTFSSIWKVVSRLELDDSEVMRLHELQADIHTKVGLYRAAEKLEIERMLRE